MPGSDAVHSLATIVLWWGLPTLAVLGLVGIALWTLISGRLLRVILTAVAVLLFLIVGSAVLTALALVLR